MAHRTRKTGYAGLVKRINKFPQGAPPSPLLNKILKILFSEKEANLVSLMPIKPFTAEKASAIWKISIPETCKILEDLANRGMLVDIVKNSKTYYVLPPPMAGFFEFSLMRVRENIDQQALSELFYQYLNVEEDFVRDLFTRGETQLGRVFVNEPALSDENAIHVLDYERASEVINTASHIAVSTCYCRHKMLHLNRACDAPLEICMSFNTAADSLIRHKTARAVELSEGLDLLALAYENNLVQFGENVKEDVGFICNCCGCCCEALIAARRFGLENPVHTTNFLPEIADTGCNGCGKCVDTCPVEAIGLVSANDPGNSLKKKAKINEEICLGCGLCVRVCSKNAIILKSRTKRVITPVNTAHRLVMMAIERGTLQDMLFDNQVLLSHRALAAVLGIIFKLPPIKQLMAVKQLKSKYLEKMIKYFEKRHYKEEKA